MGRSDRIMIVSFGVAALAFGVISGFTAAADLRSPAPATPQRASRARAKLDRPALVRKDLPTSADIDAVIRACGSRCSDFDIGMRWAERVGISDAEQCTTYTWSYRRGCLAYLREGGHRRPPA